MLGEDVRVFTYHGKPQSKARQLSCLNAYRQRGVKSQRCWRVVRVDWLGLGMLSMVIGLGLS